MARLWSCGFELNSATAGMEFDTVTGTAVTIDATVVNGGLYSLHPSTTAAVTSYITHQFDSGSASHDIYFRAYFRHDVRPDANTAILLMRDTGGAVTVWTVQISSTGTLRLLDDSNTLIGTTAALNTSQWYRIEVKYTFTGGNLELKLDGVSTLTGVGFSTALSGNQIRIGRQTAGTSANPSFYFDDVAVNDTTGSFQTGYPGAGKIVHLHPNAAGDNTNWTEGTGSSFAEVDEVTPDDATTTIATTSTGNIADFNVEATPAGMGSTDTISVVSVGHRSIGTGASKTPYLLRVKAAASGTVEESSSFTPGASYSTNKTAAPKVYHLTLYDMPGASTTAWTKADLDTAQVGVHANGGVGGLTSVTALWLLVDYTPAVAAGFMPLPNRAAQQAINRASNY